jgi:hypothetical protein
MAGKSDKEQTLIIVHLYVLALRKVNLLLRSCPMSPAHTLTLSQADMGWNVLRVGRRRLPAEKNKNVLPGGRLANQPQVLEVVYN